jgi:hypothetical protein
VVDEHFEWDDQKSETNKHKHGIDFSEARDLWRSGVDEFPSRRGSEMRYVAFGTVRKKLALVVITYRRCRRRIISARYATADERSAYESAQKGGKERR